MPSIANHQSATSTKLLMVGNSGSGKTGGLVSLAAEGYNLRILDLDDGLPIVRHYATNSASPYLKKNPSMDISFITLGEELDPLGKRLFPTKATVWQAVQSSLTNWSDGERQLGHVASWGPQDVLVVDSLTRLSDAAMDFVLQMNGHLGQRPSQPEWGQAQGLIESFIELVTSKAIKCNVIVNAHLVTIGDEATGTMQGYPATLGKALSPKIGRYFNSILLAKSSGQGANAKRRIITNTSGIIELKNAAPLNVAPEYDISDGLALFFKAVRS